MKGFFEVGRSAGGVFKLGEFGPRRKGLFMGKLTLRPGESRLSVKRHKVVISRKSK